MSQDMSTDQWIRQYEDVEASAAPDKLAKMFTLSMAMPEAALHRLAARGIKGGKVKRITGPDATESK